MKKQKNYKNVQSLVELCLPDILKGLHINFLNIKENGKNDNSIMISMKGTPIAYYALVVAEKAFYPTMKKISKIINQRSYEERT